MNTAHHPLAVLLTALATTTIPVIAATGTLDATFNSTGAVSTSFGATESANAIAVMPNGKIVVVGSTNVLGNSDIAVVRYLANGSLDKTFSSDGGTTTGIGAASQDFANAVAIQADGKIVVAGYTNADGTNDFVTARYNADGSLDTFFGAGGRVISAVGGNDDRATCVAVQPDGKIVVAGSTDGGGSDFVVFRYNANGTPDTTFSGDGRANNGFNGTEFCNALALQDDGKIVLAGYTDSQTNDFAIVRYTDTGLLDTTFDTDGKQTVAFGNDDRATGVVIQDDGAIVVAGSWDGGSSDMAIVRFNGVTGALDTAFSTDGKHTVNLGGADFCNALALQDDGKLLLGGYTNELGNNDFALLRLNSNGSSDTSFGSNAILMLDLSIGGDDRATAIALQKNGKALVAGTSLADFTVARLDTIAKTDARIGSSAPAPLGNNVYNENGNGQSLNVDVPKSGGVKTSFVRIENDGHATDSFLIGGTSGNSNFLVEYFNGNTNVSTAVKNGSFSTGNLAPGKSFTLKVRVTAKTGAANKQLTIFLTGSSDTDTTSTDTVRIKAKTK